MNFFTKTRVLITIIIVLAALNIATLGTIGYHYFKSTNTKNNDRPRIEHPGRFMAKQMRMTDEQYKNFEEMRVNFVKESDETMDQIREISKQILDEIGKESPDKSRLDELSEKFGELNKHQKHIMINHLLEVKSNCTPDQLEHFDKFIRRMENTERMRGNRNRNRAMQGSDKE